MITKWCQMKTNRNSIQNHVVLSKTRNGVINFQTSINKFARLNTTMADSTFASKALSRWFKIGVTDIHLPLSSYFRVSPKGPAFVYKMKNFPLCMSHELWKAVVNKPTTHKSPCGLFQMMSTWLTIRCEVATELLLAYNVASQTILC